MPCYDGRPDSLAEERLQNENSRLKEMYRDQQIRSDELARMLCGLCTEIDRNPVTGWKSPIDKVEGLSDWWYEHQAFDVERVLEMVSDTLDEEEIRILKENIDSL